MISTWKKKNPKAHLEDLKNDDFEHILDKDPKQTEKELVIQLNVIQQCIFLLKRFARRVFGCHKN